MAAYRMADEEIRVGRDAIACQACIPEHSPENDVHLGADLHHAIKAARIRSLALLTIFLSVYVCAHKRVGGISRR
jgi:hypothetical protein